MVERMGYLKSKLKYFYLRFMIEKDKNFLIKEGIKKAKKNSLELQIGDETLTLANPKGKISLPTNEGRTDVREIMALVAGDYPEITKRYLANLDKLDNYP